MQSGARGNLIVIYPYRHSKVAKRRKNQRNRKFPVSISKGLCLVVRVLLYTWEVVGKIPADYV